MNNILSQGKTPDGIITPHANTPVGFSKNLMHSKGSAVVLLAEIMDLSPIEVNDKLKEVQGFIEDSIIWEKVVPAFPLWSAQLIEPYDNKAVLDALSNGRFVIVITDTGHAVRYMGGGLCHDPRTGTEVPTLTYPNVKACVVLTHIEPVIEHEILPESPEEADSTIPEPQLQPAPPVPEAGIDLGSIEVHPENVLISVGNEKALLKHIKSAKRSIREIEKLLK